MKYVYIYNKKINSYLKIREYRHVMLFFNFFLILFKKFFYSFRLFQTNAYSLQIHTFIRTKIINILFLIVIFFEKLEFFSLLKLFNLGHFLVFTYFKLNKNFKIMIR